MIGDSICLRLYVEKNHQKIVPLKSGINQWNGVRTNKKNNSVSKRNINEVYISYPVEDRAKTVGFFPSKDTQFKLTLPSGDSFSAKLCQDSGKAIMSNPNHLLGKWILRDVLKIPEGKVVTYEMLEQIGIDCVIFTKLGENEYSIDYGEIGTYETFNF